MEESEMKPHHGANPALKYSVEGFFHGPIKSSTGELYRLYLEKFERDLNVSLVLAGLFSTVTSAFIIACHSKLQPGPSETSAAVLLAALLTLNQSVVPNVQPVPACPPPEILTFESSMLASLAVALLAAFLAMVGKQMYSRLWLDVILSHERCGSPRLGYEGVCLSRIMEYCPFALQVSLLLFARGIYQYMTPSYSFLLDVSVLFYLGVVTATAFSYGRAFHSQEQVMLYDSWKKATHQIVSASLLVPITILDLFQVLSSTTLRLRKMREDFVASAARRLGQIAVLMARNFKRWSEQNDPRPLQVVSDRGFSYDHLRDILSSRDELESLYRLQSTDAVAVINGLEQGLGEDSPLCTSDRKRFFVALKKMCYHHVRLPRSYVIADKLGWTGEHPIEGGGYADVWRGLYQGSQVAIKVLRVNQGADPTDLEKNFCREVVIWKQFKHPNLLPLLGTKKALRTLMVICEWMEHGTVMEFINAFPQANRLKLLADTARGLKYLHEWPYVHGNVKTENILIDGGGAARIGGFGSASLSRLNTPVESTYEWAAPELFSENSRPSKASDIYAFGMIVYEVFTGIRPFPHVSLGAMPVLILAGERPSRPMNFDVLGLSEGLWALVQQCWDRNPSNRPGIADILVHLDTASRDWVPPMLEVAVADMDVDPLTSQITSMTESADTTSADPE